jgi:hypothetical protein
VDQVAELTLPGLLCPLGRLQQLVVPADAPDGRHVGTANDLTLPLVRLSQDVK